MPWEELIWAFLKNAKVRAYWAEQAKFAPGVELREYRTLMIGGHRQSGKSEAAVKTVMAQDGARLMGGWVLGSHGRARAIQVPDDKSLDPHELVQTKLKDVKTIVIDPDLVSVGHGFDYYRSIQDVYITHREWFHPEFSVVLIADI